MYVYALGSEMGKGRLKQFYIVLAFYGKGLGKRKTVVFLPSSCLSAYKRIGFNPFLSFFKTLYFSKYD